MFDCNERILRQYYNAKDTQGTTHNGFLQAMDFSGVSIPVLNEVTLSILDAYIFNRFDRSVALAHWAHYLQYDHTAKDYRIDAAFYADFVNALFVELLQADKYNTNILKYNWTSLSAKDIEKITYGAKQTDRHYDIVNVTVTKGNDTEATTQRQDSQSIGARSDSQSLGAREDGQSIGARSDSQTLGQRQDSESLGQRQDSHTEAARTDTSTPGSKTLTHERYPLGASAYINDTKDTETYTQSTNQTGAQSGSNTIGTQSNSYTQGSQSNSSTQGAQENSFTQGAQSNSFTQGAQSNSFTEGAQTLTKTFGDQETETDARDDRETIAIHIDEKEHTKHIIITPDKYYEIQQELSRQNVYGIVASAVRRAFSASYWR